VLDPAVSDAELAEMERDARRSDLWDDDEREALFARIAAARRQRGQQPASG
jgi:hypothetical protein